jgi:hypothetical protein
MPQVITDSPIVQGAMKVHHDNTDESDGPRDIQSDLARSSETRRTTCWMIEIIHK